MSYGIRWALNKMSKTENKNLPIMSVVEVKKARAFHESIPQYQVIPPTNLKNMTEYLSLAKARVKDESCRFGLNTSKVLGGSYAVARYIAKETGCDISQMPYSVLASKELRDKFDQITFFSVTDGDHGRGIVWAANRLGQRCIIRIPVDSTEGRCHHIEDESVECTIEKVNYDDCVRIVTEEAKHAEHSVVIQDTAWEGYGEIPSWIMQGCSTMADEAVEQLEERPTHVLVQAGAGSLARNVVGCFANKYKKNPPVMVVVRAESAACLYRGTEATDGEMRIVDGEMPTIVAGLCCGEPNVTSRGILKNHVIAFLIVDNDVARRGIRMLAALFEGDPQVVSGESDVTIFGALTTIMKDESYHKLRSELELNQDSKVLMFSTEEDTDPDHYKTIIWEGGLK